MVRDALLSGGRALLGAVSIVVLAATGPGAQENEVRPFKANIPQDQVEDMRQRLQKTRWPDKETVADASQGAGLDDLRELVQYWGTDYDWREGEARLNALPQFVTEIDGLDIHFIHVRSPHPDALPIIISHGWPGSVFEQIKLIGPLTDPTAHGGSAEDAFDVVIPSLPGFGFSEIPTEPGWGPERIAGAWALLMDRLGYERYVAQGGDWGSPITHALGRLAPEGLAGIHVNLPAAVPDEVVPALMGAPPPDNLTDEESATLKALASFIKEGNLAYVAMMGARPQGTSYAHVDSPAGLAGWMLVHPGFAKWSYGKDASQSPTRDDVLDNFSLYWLTNTAASAARIYWEYRGRSITSASQEKTSEIKVPVGVSVFPDEVYSPPESWAKMAYPTLTYYNRAAAGGHFAAWEYPEEFAAELRAAFASVR